MKHNDIEVIRHINTALVLDTLRKAGGHLSRPMMAEQLGLSKVTVSTIVRSLNKKGLIVETGMGETDSRGGRRPVLLTLDPDKKRVLGACLGHSSIDLILSDITGREVKKIRTESTGQDQHSTLVAMVNEILKFTGTTSEEILGLACAVSEPEENIAHQNLNNDNSNLLLLEMDLNKTLGFPTLLTNAIKARAFGESWLSSTNNIDTNFYFVNLGPRLSGMPVTNGQLEEKMFNVGACYLTALPRGDLYGELVTLNSVLDGEALLEKASNAFNRKINRAEFEKMAISGNKEVLDLYLEYGYNLGCALSLVVNLTGLDNIIIGGEMSRGWTFFQAAMQEGLNRHIPSSLQNKIEVRLIRSELSNGLLGAMTMALDRWVFDTKMLHTKLGA